jgi:hypothetical protein
LLLLVPPSHLIQHFKKGKLTHKIGLMPRGPAATTMIAIRDAAEYRDAFVHYVNTGNLDLEVGE